MAELTMEIRVDEYLYSEDRKTYIRLDLGKECYLSFVIPDRVEVPKYIQFKAPLESCDG